jgi:hypothetical protein
MLAVIGIAGFETMPPSGSDAIIIVGMDELPPAELILAVGPNAEHSQGISTKIGEPSGGVG